MIVASNPSARMKSNRNVERAIQSFQGMVKTLRSSLEFRRWVETGIACALHLAVASQAREELSLSLLSTKPHIC